MGNEDRTLKILLQLLSDVRGAREIDAAVDQTKGKLEEAGKATTDIAKPAAQVTGEVSNAGKAAGDLTRQLASGGASAEEIAAAVGGIGFGLGAAVVVAAAVVSEFARISDFNEQISVEINKQNVELNKQVAIWREQSQMASTSRDVLGITEKTVPELEKLDQAMRDARGRWLTGWQSTVDVIVSQFSAIPGHGMRPYQQALDGLVDDYKALEAAALGEANAAIDAAERQRLAWEAVQLKPLTDGIVEYTARVGALTKLRDEQDRSTKDGVLLYRFYSQELEVAAGHLEELTRKQERLTSESNRLGDALISVTKGLDDKGKIEVTGNHIASLQAQIVALGVDAQTPNEAYEKAKTLIDEQRVKVQQLALAWAVATGQLNSYVTSLAKSDAERAASIKDVTDRIAVLNAQASGDKYAANVQLAKQAYDQVYASLRLKDVPEKEAVELANKYKDAVLAARNAQLQQTESVRGTRTELSAMLRESETILQRIRGEQQLITQNPFMSADDKARALLQSYTGEMRVLSAEMQRQRDFIRGTELDPAQLQRAKQELQKLGFEFQGLGQKVQALSFGGQLRAGLTQWTNSFGTTANQIGKAIGGSINASLQHFNQLLLTGKFNAQQLLLSIAQIGLTLVEQLLLQMAMSAINSIFQIQQAAATGQAVGAAWAAPATLATIATEGQAALTAPGAIAAAMAAVQGIAIAHEGGVVGHNLPSWGGGPLASDERLVVTRVGETILPTHLGSARVNVPRMHEGGIVGGGGIGLSGDKIEIHVWDDKETAIRKHFRSPAGRKFLKQAQRRNRV